ncbi:ECF transporter S component, folate family [Ruminococcus flavefaciens]|uniref:ECF transporter S component, folate family n=1 Tax=Ruminococcus flavefaciens TaxID=1265 RepID=A0A1H6JDB7_RUMFL|nr:folate family ECF transporter S component [Ruminococcus flavefaciens]SEH57670.1 ECF transporter S component, folate family [Ruminococcus flavefaciens]
MITNNRGTAVKSDIRLFGSTKVLIIAGLLAAMSMVLGKLGSINIGNSIRIGFGGLPIQMAGIFFGPVIGGAVGLVADVVGCIMKGYAINPIITIGSTCIGVFSGLVYHFALRGVKNALLPKIAASTVTAHAIGSMMITSIGLYVYYHTPFETLLFRVPIYLITAAIETAVIYLMLKNKAFTAELNKVRRK